MSWIEVAGVVIGIIACTFGIVFLPILIVGLIDHIVESVRKNKYPEYFDLYDSAIYESFRIGGKFNKEKERISYKLKKYTDGYKDGECTKEFLEKKMQELTQSYIEICDIYNQEHQAIKVLWKRVNEYAKKHNLKWGIIYDN